MSETEQSTPDLTYGQKAVGIKFNPGKSSDVDKVKQTFADLIDLVEAHRTANDSRFANTLKTYAVQTLVAAQMAVVKVVTWTE